MTSNREKAAEVIWDAQASGLAKPSDLADALEDEGLLAPNLPEPTGYDELMDGWGVGEYFIQRTPGGLVLVCWESMSAEWVTTEESILLDTATIAAIVAAAADHAEGVGRADA